MYEMMELIRSLKIKEAESSDPNIKVLFGGLTLKENRTVTKKELRSNPDIRLEIEKDIRFSLHKRIYADLILELRRIFRSLLYMAPPLSTHPTDLEITRLRQWLNGVIDLMTLDVTEEPDPTLSAILGRWKGE